MADDPLTVTLPADLSACLRNAVATGEYVSVEAALADAVGAWSRREEDLAEQEGWIRARIRASIHDPRPSLSMAEVRAHMKQVFARARSSDDEAA